MCEKIFDAHVHFYPEAIAEKACVSLGNFYTFVPEGKGTFGDFTEHAKENGVFGFLAFSVATTAHQVERINDFIAEKVSVAKAIGFDAHGFAAMHQDYEHPEIELERAISLGLKGIKIHPDIQRFDLLDERFYKICEIAEGRLSLCLHIGDERDEYRYSMPEKLAKVCDDFPRLKILAAHLGGYQTWDEGRKYLWHRENIWYDVSSTLWAVEDKTFISDFMKSDAGDRIMFGSDYPVCYPGRYMEHFNKLDIDENIREKVLYKNALEFVK